MPLKVDEAKERFDQLAMVRLQTSRTLHRARGQVFEDHFTLGERIQDGLQKTKELNELRTKEQQLSRTLADLPQLLPGLEPACSKVVRACVSRLGLRKYADPRFEPHKCSAAERVFC
jgi:hypothetical protein